MKFIVDLWLDGYDSEEEMGRACVDFIYEQLNMTASFVKIKLFDDGIVRNRRYITSLENRIVELEAKE